MNPRVLVVEDKEYELQSLVLVLEDEGLDVTGFSDPKAALAHLESHRTDILVTDLRMPGMDGMELLTRARDLHPDLEALVMTAYGSIDTAVEAVKRGAFHYIVKSPSLAEELLLVLQRVVRQISLQRRVQELSGEGDEERLCGLAGGSTEIREAFSLIRAVAPHDTTVLIRGETGTGKGLAAEAVHRLSPRRDEPLVIVDCASLPENLLESELFGHVRGAFTGAVETKEGKILGAGRGTLVLDEIGELPMASQPKLLRLLEERVFFPVGSSEPASSEARIVACTNRDLEEMVEQGTFRLDLFHRLNVVTVVMPPLRQHRQDLAGLVRYLVGRIAHRSSVKRKEPSPEAMSVLHRYHWPGNVRQLVHALERALVVGHAEKIEPEDLPPELRAGPETGRVDGEDSLRAAERRLIVRVLGETGWNIHEASRRLEISRPTLYSKIKKHEITRDG